MDRLQVNHVVLLSKINRFGDMVPIITQDVQANGFDCDHGLPVLRWCDLAILADHAVPVQLPTRCQQSQFGLCFEIKQVVRCLSDKQVHLGFDQHIRDELNLWACPAACRQRDHLVLGKEFLYPFLQIPVHNSTSFTYCMEAINASIVSSFQSDTGWLMINTAGPS